MITMLPPPPAKPIHFPNSVILAGKKRVRQATYIRECSELQEDLSYDYGCHLGSLFRDGVGSYQK